MIHSQFFSDAFHGAGETACFLMVDHLLGATQNQKSKKDVGLITMIAVGAIDSSFEIANTNAFNACFKTSQERTPLKEAITHLVYLATRIAVGRLANVYFNAPISDKIVFLGTISSVLKIFSILAESVHQKIKKEWVSENVKALFVLRLCTALGSELVKYKIIKEVSRKFDVILSNKCVKITFLLDSIFLFIFVIASHIKNDLFQFDKESLQKDPNYENNKHIHQAVSNGMDTIKNLFDKGAISFIEILPCRLSRLVKIKMPSFSPVFNTIKNEWKNGSSPSSTYLKGLSEIANNDAFIDFLNTLHLSDESFEAYEDLQRLAEALMNKKSITLDTEKKRKLKSIASSLLNLQWKNENGISDDISKIQKELFNYYKQNTQFQESVRKVLTYLESLKSS